MKFLSAEFLVGIVTIIASLGLFLLLITRVFFVFWVLVDKNCGIVEALAESNRIGENNFTTIVLSIFAMIAAVFIGSLILIVPSLLITSNVLVVASAVGCFVTFFVIYFFPVHVFFYGNIYHQLKNKNK